MPLKYHVNDNWSKGYSPNINNEHFEMPFRNEEARLTAQSVDITSSNQLYESETRSQNTESEPFIEEELSQALIPTNMLKVSNHELEKSLSRGSRRLFAGWQRTVILSCTCTVFALACNVALLAWALRKSKSPTGSFLLWEGDCNRSRTISRWSHLGINILSSLILSGSNYAMQVLVAPTRSDLNKSHKKGQSLEVGIQGFKNWRYLGRPRRFLYLGLLLTSIPLHLIYNSVLFSTTSTFNFRMYLVSQDFLDVNPTHRGSPISEQDTRYLLWQGVRKGNWTRLDNTYCYGTFSKQFVPDYKNVIMVSDTVSTNANQSWFDEDIHEIISLQKFRWFCAHTVKYHCEPDINQANDWKISYFSIEGKGGKAQARVQYCIAEAAQPLCTIEFLPPLLSIVIVCNVLKALALMMLIFYKFKPLLTIGDAIASFMDQPDSTTKGWGAVSVQALEDQPAMYQKASIIGRKALPEMPWISERQRYFSGASPRRWTLTVLICILYWSIGCCLQLLSASNADTSIKSQWEEGLGTIDPKMTATGWNLPIIINILVANTPQLILSLVYLFYNGLFTCMLVSAEWTSFVRKRKALRVTRPVGQQRSTYFLSLPYRFSLPLLIASIVLHWMLSQSLFLAQVNAYNTDGSFNREGSLQTIGWSAIALMILLIIGGLLIVTAIAFGFRRYDAGIPLVRSDSRAISSACHPAASCDDAQSSKPLQYGVISHNEEGRGHVGFSSGQVKLLLDGQIYM